jgi:superfamily II DNA or RNA helicase
MKILNLFIGDMLYCITGRFKNYYKIRRLFFHSTNEAYNEDIKDFRGNPSYSKMLKNILLYRFRTLRIVDQIEECYVKEKRTVLVLSHEIAHLEEMQKELLKRGIDDVAFFIGKLKKDQLKESEKKSILLATYSMADEGMDIPKMNTLILASPKTNIKQAIGRIDRILHTPMKALVIDVIDTFSVFEKQGEKRNQYYKKYGFESEYVHINDSGTVLSKKTYASKQNLEQEWDWEEEEEEDEEDLLVSKSKKKEEEDEDIPLSKEEEQIAKAMEELKTEEDKIKQTVKKVTKKTNPTMAPRKNLFQKTDKIKEM